MIYKNLPKDDLTAQLYLKFLFITQHEVPFMNTFDATKKGRMTEQRTANVQMSKELERYLTKRGYKHHFVKSQISRAKSIPRKDTKRTQS